MIHQWDYPNKNKFLEFEKIKLGDGETRTTRF